MAAIPPTSISISTPTGTFLHHHFDLHQHPDLDIEFYLYFHFQLAPYLGLDPDLHFDLAFARHPPQTAPNAQCGSDVELALPVRPGAGHPPDQA